MQKTRVRQMQDAVKYKNRGLKEKQDSEEREGGGERLKSCRQIKPHSTACCL